MNIQSINPTYYSYTPQYRRNVSFQASPIKMVKDRKLINLYGSDTLGHVNLNNELIEVMHSGDMFYALRREKEPLGYMIILPRMFDGKTCYSCAEIRNNSDLKGVGTKLLQIGLKVHKDSGKTGEFRVHDVLEEAEEFYEKLGFMKIQNVLNSGIFPMKMNTYSKNIMADYKNTL